METASQFRHEVRACVELVALLRGVRDHVEQTPVLEALNGGVHKKKKRNNSTVSNCFSYVQIPSKYCPKSSGRKISKRMAKRKARPRMAFLFGQLKWVFLWCPRAAQKSERISWRSFDSSHLVSLLASTAQASHNQ